MGGDVLNTGRNTFRITGETKKLKLWPTIICQPFQVHIFISFNHGAGGHFMDCQDKTGLPYLTQN